MRLIHDLARHTVGDAAGRRLAAAVREFLHDSPAVSPEYVRLSNALREFERACARPGVEVR